MKYFRKIAKRYKNDGFISSTFYYFKVILHGISFIFRAIFKCIVKFIVKFIVKLICKSMRILKIKEYIVLESESDFSDNPYAFYKYLLNIDFEENHKIIWLVKNVDYCRANFAHKNVIFINRFNNSARNIIQLNYYLSVSKWIIFSHPYWFKNWRKKQIVLNTTHSVAQLKGKSIKFDKIFDYALACSEYGSKIKQEIFNVEPERVVCLGMPRVDLMFENVYCKSKLIENYNNEKLIVSMETFKQSSYWHDSDYVESYAINIIDNENDLLSFDDFLGKNNCKMIVKIHHLQDLSFLKKVKLNNIYYLTDDDLFYKNVQINNLLTNADVLLTDYSSVFYDYLLMDRPIGFMLGDFESYSRGFIMDDPLSEMPGEKIYNINALKQFIISSINGKDDYREEREIIKNNVFKYMDNNNCKRLYQWLIEKGEKK